MKEVIVKTKIKNNDEIIKKSYKAELNKNEIKYLDSGILTIIKILKKRLVLTRNNNEYSIELNFEEKKQTKGIYNLKELNRIILLKIYTKEQKIEKDNIYIEYELYNEENKLGDYMYSINIKEEIWK